MTEKHYARRSPSYVASTISAGFPTPGIVEQTTLRRLAAPANLMVLVADLAAAQTPAVGHPFSPSKG